MFERLGSKGTRAQRSVVSSDQESKDDSQNVAHGE